MLGKLLLLFTVIPVVELYLLITIGESLGVAATVALVLGTGLVGASLAKREGSRVLRNWQRSLELGEMPKEGVTSSLLVLVGGVLLVTPGVVTDLTGLLLLVPWTRRLVAGVVNKQLASRLETRSFMVGPEGFIDMAAAEARGRPGSFIDVDVVESEAEAYDEPEPARAATVTAIDVEVIERRAP